MPSAFPQPTPSGRATYQISHGEKFENGPISPILHWPCPAPAIGERDRPGRTRRRPADGIPFHPPQWCYGGRVVSFWGSSPQSAVCNPQKVTTDDPDGHGCEKAFIRVHTCNQWSSSAFFILPSAFCLLLHPLLVLRLIKSLTVRDLKMAQFLRSERLVPPIREGARPPQ